ncbi:MAG TPA: HU family DNA-binding protein [Oligoflexia bacterium]|nr:HU family DNA-binding protein [Oligoflexia bacterium]HMP47715.1 HU family DNA-binding protein [Oligoflexia bacterium]
MNKSELVEKMAERSGIGVIQAEELANLMFGKMKASLLNGDRIEIRGFGRFKVKQYESYWGRNPKTGEKILVSPKKLPTFKLGKELKKRLNGGELPGVDD